VIDWETLASKLDSDGEFRVAARLWTATLRLEVGDDIRALRIEDGRVVSVERSTRDAACDVFVSAPAQVWESTLEPTPAPFFQDLFPAILHHGLAMNADILDYAAYYPALRRMLEVMREARTPAVSPEHTAAGAKPPHATQAAPRPPTGQPHLDRATGRYIHLELDGIDHRVYFEESGSGIPLLCQHTAGADGRQWRHLHEDDEVTRYFHLIAYDLPYHGKSLPPVAVRWWAEEYRLTRDFLMQVPVALSRALGLERPVFMGSSIGGHLALDLARYHADDFRAVISLEGAASTPGSWLDIWDHPRVSNAFKANVMYGLMSPTSPEALRHETIWGYSQGAPPTFKGDLYYHGVDHDLTDELGRIDTSKIDVWMMTGQYDFNTTPEMSRATAAAIAGARFTEMKGLGHFPMSEDPARFRDYLLPVLAAIRAKDPPQMRTEGSAKGSAQTGAQCGAQVRAQGGDAKGN
jgi:pimeloyl-ACP methyl ester carboxylesterase